MKGQKEKKPLLPLGRLFRNLKAKIVTDFITSFLAKLLEKFKASNPQIWLVLVTVATVLQFGISAVVEITIPGVQVPPEFLSIDWIIAQTGLEVPDTVTDIVMWLLLAITGSKTTAYLSEEARNAKIEATKAKIRKQGK